MIEQIENELFARKHKLACLYKRLFHMNEKLAAKSEYEKNEVKIQRINTIFELSKEISIIKLKQNIFDNEFEKIRKNT